MYNAKNISGILSLGKFIRLEVGSKIIYEVADGITYKEAQNFVNSYSKRAGAKIAQQKLLIVDPANAHTIEAIRVTLLETGDALKTTGRKKT